ncbi:hypothetical protein BDZ97DRAFT_1809218 [Flammula alnicola]|nr:hypothetical protein BDZ97DRAFT_1809218 [Flammula alnicola]
MDAYMNSLPQPTNMTMSANRNTHPQQQLLSPEEEMQRQLEEFKRSVTIIIWYKANAEPIRLQQFLPTFPYFQLSRFSNLIKDLGLSSSSYLDTYIPASNQWEQHTTTSVRIVETQQRLIYKVRRSLMEGLSEDECPSLQDELQMQPRMNGAHPSSTNNVQSSSLASPSTQPTADAKTNNDGQSKNMLKRSAPQGDQESRHSPKVHVTNGYYMSHSGSNTMVSSPVAGPSSSNTSTPTLASPQSSAQAQPDNNVYMYQNSRWPNDYTVSELSAGFHAMDLLISQSPTGASMTQRTAFERVFGSRYVKSTVCRHRAVWRKAPRVLREQFEHMGTDDRACWGEFVRRVENRPPGKNANIELMPPQQNPTIGGYHEQQNSTENEDVHGQEGVMGSMQNQVSSAPNGSAMQNSMNVYDPSRNHLTNGAHNG